MIKFKLALGRSGWKLYLVCELETGSGQLFEFNQKKQAQSGLGYLRTKKRPWDATVSPAPLFPGLENLGRGADLSPVR